MLPPTASWQVLWALFSMSQAVSDGVPVKETWSWRFQQPHGVGGHLSGPALPSDLGQPTQRSTLSPLETGSAPQSGFPPQVPNGALWNAGHSGLARPGLQECVSRAPAHQGHMSCTERRNHILRGTWSWPHWRREEDAPTGGSNSSPTQASLTLTIPSPNPNPNHPTRGCISVLWGWEAFIAPWPTLSPGLASY